MDRCNWCREQLCECSCTGGPSAELEADVALAEDDAARQWAFEDDEPDHGELVENEAFEGADEYYGGWDGDW
jgi:hypothetical protein